MNQPGRLQVPGKVMIAGEYSVLGSEGLALAIAVSPGIELAAYRAAAWSVSRRDTGEAWHAGAAVPAGLSFLHQALMSVSGAQPLAVSAWTPAVVGSGDLKPGFGGSASAVVGGLALALASAGEQWPRDAFIQAAHDLHRRAQGGRGSGYDVATIAVGGAVTWTVLERDSLGVSRGRANRAQLAPGIGFLAGYAGRSANTTRLVTRVSDRLGPERDAAYRDLGAPVSRLVAALGLADSDELMQATAEARTALERFDGLVGGGLLTPEIQALLATADALRVPCKVSGAGGGDSVVAFDLDPQRLAALHRAWEGAGHRAFSLCLAGGAWSEEYPLDV